MFYFFDSSALVKYYILEPGSTWVRDVIDAHGRGDDLSFSMIFIAEVTIVECAAAFAILGRVGRISRRAQQGVFSAFIKDLSAERYQVVATRSEDFYNAADLTQRHPLKAYDAVQLAVALRQERILNGRGLSSIFVCGDKTLLTAAKAEGLAVENPFDHLSTQEAFT